jgi:hypothetical protein
MEYRDKSLMAELDGLPPQETAVVLIDEIGTPAPENVFEGNLTLLQYRTNQGAVLLQAARLGIHIFVIMFGQVKESWEYEDFSMQTGESDYGSYQNVVPAQSLVYKKNLGTPDATSNKVFAGVIAGFKHVIIMGQSRNACCANTAKGISKPSQIYTSPYVVRYGDANPSAVYNSEYTAADKLKDLKNAFEEDFSDFQWPEKTIIFKTL